MMTAGQIKRWLRDYKEGDPIAINDDGMALVLVGDEDNNYLEVGGVPLEDDFTTNLAKAEELLADLNKRHEKDDDDFTTITPHGRCSRCQRPLTRIEARDRSHVCQAAPPEEPPTKSVWACNNCDRVLTDEEKPKPCPNCNRLGRHMVKQRRKR